MVYEWFTLNGEPLSSSAGNIVTVSELLDLLEPAVLRYFFALHPKKARATSTSNDSTSSSTGSTGSSARTSARSTTRI